jgi:hypothetical protein
MCVCVFRKYLKMESCPSLWCSFSLWLVFLSGSESLQFFNCLSISVLLYIQLLWGGWDFITQFNLVPSKDMDFLSKSCFFVFSGLRWEVSCLFLDMDWIDVLHIPELIKKLYIFTSYFLYARQNKTCSSKSNGKDNEFEYHFHIICGYIQTL